MSARAARTTVCWCGQEGIKGLIASLQGFGFAEAVIKAELIKRYSLSETEAIEYLNGQCL